MIKHRDDWAGDVDIATFAPRSIKSDGDFEDILAQDNPDVWESHKPAEGGAAGKMLSDIIAKAAALKLKSQGSSSKSQATKKTSKKKTVTRGR